MMFSRICRSRFAASMRCSALAAERACSRSSSCCMSWSLILASFARSSMVSTRCDMSEYAAGGMNPLLRSSWILACRAVRWAPS